jgi:hypothetical protein
MDRHLDAERLAAFMAGSLSRAERRAVEDHASGCAECLQLLAAMARTEPVPIRPHGWQLFRPLRWAVPLAAGVTAIALWVNVERGGRTPPPAVPSQTLADSAAPPDTQRRAPSPPPETRTAPRDTSPTMPLATAPNQAAVENPQPPPARIDAIEERKQDKDKAPLPLAREKPAAAPPVETGAAAGTAADDRARRFESAGARAAVSAVEVVSPDPLRRWRVAGLAVLGSADGGKTWTTQLASAGGEVLAGFAPAPDVAWLAGRAGLVLLTTDAASWQRIPFPEAVDLVAVRARSAREADVTAADGRTFRTADGGKTWSPQQF